MNRENKSEYIELYDGIRIKILISKEDGANFDLCILEMDSGTEAPLHKHEEDEAFYILSGELEFHLGERKVKATQGDHIYVPKGLNHSAFNLAKNKVKAIVVHNPPRF